MFNSSSEDEDFELKVNEQGDIPSMFQEQPLMRSMGLFEGGQHDLNRDTTRGAMGFSDVSFGGLGESSFWGQQFEDHDNEGDLGIPSLGGKDLERPDLSQIKLQTPGASMYSKVHLVAQAAPAQQLKQTALEPLPFFIEEYSSFITKSSSPDLIAALSSLFGTLQVDADPYMHQHRMKGLAHNVSRSASVSFRVQIYRSEVEGERVCEFQRRQGCVVTFHDLYQKSMQLLGEHVERPYREVAKATPHALPPAKVDLDAETVNSLFSMARSRNADVQREGLGMLAALSADPAAQTNLVQNHADDTFQVLGAALGSADDQVQRCASLLASNLCQQEPFRDAACAQILGLLLDKLCQSAECLTNRATKRHLSCTLATLSSTHCDKFPEDLERLKVYAGSGCAVLRGSIQECINNHVAFQLAAKAV